MNILVTNDDGISAKGIRTLAESLKPFGNIYVVAPDSEKSAVGHGITVHNPIRVYKSELYGEDIKAWSVSGTPSDCVKIAVENILEVEPDVVVSGINNGANLGTDVLYSGTVSAAVEGSIYKIPSIAMSLAGKGELNYEVANHFIPKIFKQIVDNNMLKKCLLNINIPSVNVGDIKGIEVTELGTIRYKNSFIERIDPMGRTYYWMAGEIEDSKNKEKSDVIAIKNNRISITPLQFDLTNYSLLNEKIKVEFQEDNDG